MTPRLEFYSPSGTRLQDTTSGAIEAKLSAGGAHTLVVSDQEGTRTGTYSLVWQRLNQPCNAASLTPGQQVFSSIAASGQISFYSFTAATNDPVAIRLTRASGDWVPYMDLYTPAGTLVKGTREGWIDATLKAAGPYTLLVRDEYSVHWAWGPQDGTRTGNYTLLLERLNNPGNGRPVSAGQQVFPSLGKPGQIDLYTFTAAANDAVIIRLTRASGDWVPVIEFYSPAGSVVKATREGWIDAKLNEAGPYTLLVRDEYSVHWAWGPQNGTRTGDYSLVLERLNNPGTGRALSAGQQVSPSIGKAGQVDLYTFTAAANDAVAIRLTRASGELVPYMDLYSPVGDLVKGTRDGWIDATLKAAGPYTLLVRDEYSVHWAWGPQNGTRTGNYTLVLQRLNNPAQTPPLAPGQQVFSSVGKAGQIDLYTFTAAANDAVTIRLTRASGDLVPVIEFYSPAGSVVKATREGWIDAKLREAGPYTLLVRDEYSVHWAWGPQNGTRTGTYSLGLQRLNNPSNAASLPCGQQVFPSINLPGQIAFYTFPAVANDAVTVRLTRTSGELVPYMDLYSPAGDLVQSTGEGRIDATLKAAGPYSLLVRDEYSVHWAWGPQGGNRTGGYSLVWQRLNRPCEQLPPGAVSISSIVSNRGGDSGSVTVTVYGSGFKSGAQVKLAREGQPDIPGQPVNVSDGGWNLTTTFDLRGKARGVWDVVVTNPDGASAKLAAAFTIEQGGAPRLWLNVVGRTRIARGREAAYEVAFGNQGNLDAKDILLWLAVPEGVTFSVDVPYLVALGPQPQDVAFPRDGSVYLWLYSDSLAVNEVKSLGLRLTSVTVGPLEVSGGIFEGTAVLQRLSSQHATTERSASLGTGESFEAGSFPRELRSLPQTEAGLRPGDIVFKLSDPDEPLRAGHEGIYVGDGHIIDLVPDRNLITGRYRQVDIEDWAPAGTYLGGGRPPGVSDAQATAAAEDAVRVFKNWEGRGWPAVPFQVPPVWGTDDCVSFVNDRYRAAGYSPPWPDWYSPGAIYQLVTGKKWPEKSVWRFLAGINDPLLATSSLDGLFSPVTLIEILVVTAIDPNDKAGLSGYGPMRHLSGDQTARYIIYFENLPIATAPAQAVVIADQLDSAGTDPTTLRLGPIRFGTKEVVPPVGPQEFTTEVDLRPAQNLLVRVDARLNAATGELTWRLTSIDPATGQPPADPLAGFLPPNKVSPQGQGSVVFTVEPRKGLATGTQIRNRATIIFDKNPPINTPEWLNTIDSTKPASRVEPLAATQNTAAFTVRWSGSDVGAGIRDYTIFVSENQGPYSLWLQDTTATSGTFAGQPGRSYAFYSVARDGAGNVEGAPTTPDATTRVVGNVTVAATVNAASFASAGTPLAPGSIVSIFGSGFDPTLSVFTKADFVSGSSPPTLPTTLSGVSVKIGGQPAALFFLGIGSASNLAPGAFQINCQVPLEAASGALAVEVLYRNALVASGAVNVSQTGPGIFTMTQSGQGQAIVVNQDGSVNGDPAKPAVPGTNPQPAERGSAVVIYGTGPGPQFKDFSTGQPLSLATGQAASCAGQPLFATAQTPVVAIGAVRAQVLFSGMAPCFVGLWQLNVKVPENAPIGSDVPLSVSIGGRMSNLTTISLR